jgi:hypothetical protein
VILISSDRDKRFFYGFIPLDANSKIIAEINTERAKPDFLGIRWILS